VSLYFYFLNKNEVSKHVNGFLDPQLAFYFLFPNESQFTLSSYITVKMTIIQKHKIFTQPMKSQKSIFVMNPEIVSMCEACSNAEHQLN